MKFDLKIAILTAILIALIVTTILLLNGDLISAYEDDYIESYIDLNLSKENKYSDFKWGEMPLKYNYDGSCSFRATKIDYALEEIERLTSNKVSFVKVKENEDIQIICDISAKSDEDNNYLGKASVKYSVSKNAIIGAKVYLYGDVDKKCSYPDVEIHEFLHVLGQGHNDIKESIMYPIHNRCVKEIDSEVDYGIFNHLEGIY